MPHAAMLSMNIVFPAYAVWFLLAFGIFFPLVMLGAKPFVLPLLQQVEAITVGKGVVLPWYFWTKLLGFLVLGVGCLTWLRLRLESLYIGTWAQQVRRPHTLHSDYYPAEPYSIQALTKWGIYRLLRLGTLPTMAFLALGLSGLFQFWVLNAFFDTAFIRWPIVYIFGLFWMFALGLLCVVALVNSAWQAIGTVFGVYAVTTEPLRPLPVLFNRCARVLSHAPMMALFILGKLVVAAAWLGLGVGLIWQYDLAQVVTPSFPWGLVMLALLGLGVVEILLGYAGFRLYHQALSRFYSGLPRFIQESFHSPISLFEEDQSVHEAQA